MTEGTMTAELDPIAALREAQAKLVHHAERIEYYWHEDCSSETYVESATLKEAKAALDAAIEAVEKEREELLAAIDKVEFSAYPAHGSGFIAQATGIDLIQAIQERRALQETSS